MDVPVDTLPSRRVLVPRCANSRLGVHVCATREALEAGCPHRPCSSTSAGWRRWKLGVRVGTFGTFRHSFATSRRAGTPCTMQEVLRHRDVRTTMIYKHILNRGGRGVRSPADGLVRDLDER